VSLISLSGTVLLRPQSLHPAQAETENTDLLTFRDTSDS
jgi:hypothetical protein